MTMQAMQGSVLRPVLAHTQPIVAAAVTIRCPRQASSCRKPALVLPTTSLTAVPTAERRRVAAKALTQVLEIETQLVPEQPSTAPQSLEPALFTWPGHDGAQTVELRGSWDDWSTPILLTRPHIEADFTATVHLPAGQYQYKFVVDNHWTVSLADEAVCDAKGIDNNTRLVGPAPAPKSTSAHPTSTLVLIPQPQPSTALLTNASFPSLCTPAPSQRVLEMLGGSLQEPPSPQQHLNAFRLFFHAGQAHEEVWLHYRRMRDGVAQTQEFTSVPMSAPFAARHWRCAAVLPSTPLLAGGDESLEVYLSLASGHQVRPAGNGCWQLARPTAFKLEGGQLRAFQRGAAPRMVLVADIDGTMIGDTPGDSDCFASTARFQRAWQSGNALVGSRLVYNTGRSIGLVQDVLRDSGGRMPTPDAVITAVGTKIFRPAASLLPHQQSPKDCHVVWGPGGRVEWVEDRVYSRRLAVGWDLGVVRQAVGDILGRVRDERRARVGDWGDEHPHRVAMMVEAGLAPGVISELTQCLRGAGLAFKIITSSAGNHKYLDIISAAGGKEAALQYVRQLYGVSQAATVAAGDSGNDMLMLEGPHPAIVVGNAQGELHEWALGQAGRSGGSSCGSSSSSGSGADLRVDNTLVVTEQWCADGVMEGLSRLGLL